MPPEVVTQVSSLGLSGLLFVVWWVERQNRGRGAAVLRDGLHYARQTAELNRNLLDVLRANTAALTALREELHAHRAAELECLARLTEQIEELRDPA